MEGRSRDRPMYFVVRPTILSIHPSMEGRSRDRPMVLLPHRSAHRRDLQWRGGHVTARWPFSVRHWLPMPYLQWRGGHVTARCP